MPYEPFTWPCEASIPLASRSAPLEVDLAGLLERRQTLRGFLAPATDWQLGEFLWLTCRSRTSRPSLYGSDQESRPHPSAGAMHPIHVLASPDPSRLCRYNPVTHSLDQLPCSQASAAAARTAAGELVTVDRAVVLALVAEPGKTAAKYVNFESLVWRDAGVVLGYMSLVAEALGLSFCPLGITGDEQLRALPDWPAGLHGAGLALLGKEP